MAWACAGALLTACGRPSPRTEQARVGEGSPASPLSDSAFAALSARLSEAGGFFDTDNLISNERGYLNVVGALGRRGVRGGAYIGVGPDQNFSYIAWIRPAIAFITDIRRDNLLHHLLLKALIERSPTRIEFLTALHGKLPPLDPEAWRARSVDDIVAYVDAAPVDSVVFARTSVAVDSSVLSYGIPLTEEDLGTIHRFHRVFFDAGMSLRFNTLGRPPRPYYPTYRELVRETDAEGVQASYLVDAERYAVVRDLELANRIIPVVGDLAGPHAIREMGTVAREMDVSVSAFYVSNVEFYLWRAGTLGQWIDNVRALPSAPNAVIIRSYFPRLGGPHPFAVAGYYATQTLQPMTELRRGGFGDYRELVTRGALPPR